MLLEDSNFFRDAQAYLRRHWQGWLRLRQKLRFSEDAFHLVLAGGVGVIGGLVNLFVYYAIESAKKLFLRQLGDPVEIAEFMEPWQRLCIPVVGGFIAGLILYFGLRLAGPQRSSNILEVVVAGDGRLPFRTAMVKFFSSLMSIGTGASIGREGSITQLSATLASKWGQLLRWPPYRLRLLVGCGAASGIAAAYNAPISGAVFASSIVLGNFSMRLFAPIVFSSVVATILSRSFFVIRSVYTIQPVEITSLSQLPWFVILGLVSGAIGALFLKVLDQSEQFFKKLRAPVYTRLAIGGLGVGLLALPYYGVWGNGSVMINRILYGEYGSGAFAARDIAGGEGLIARLSQPPPGDEAARFVLGHLSPRTLELLSAKGGGSRRALNRALAKDLNELIRSGPIYTPERFAGVDLNPATREMLGKKLPASEFVRLNRMLLLDAFPRELSRGPWQNTTYFDLLVLVGLFLAKFLATAITVGSGAVGGVFTPTLFLGAGFGAIFGMALQQLGAGLDFSIQPYAIVGMGSVLAATTHSPLLAMIMIYEISSDYSLMPPLMLACVVSTLVARRLRADSIYTEPLRRKGLKVSQTSSTSEAATERSVADIMGAPVPPLRETASLKEIANRFLTSANNFLPVVDSKNQLIGLVALQDLKEHLNAGEEIRGVIAYDIMRPPPACVTPNQRLLDVLPVVMASEQRNVPVVNTLKEYRLVGALSRAEVLSIFSEAIAMSSKGEE